MRIYLGEKIVPMIIPLTVKKFEALVKNFSHTRNGLGKHTNEFLKFIRKK